MLSWQTSIPSFTGNYVLFTEHYHLCESELQQGNVEMIIVAPINKLSISEVDTSDI